MRMLNVIDTGECQHGVLIIPSLVGEGIREALKEGNN